MGRPQRTETPLYTHADYLLFPEGERWELVEGSPINMSPAPDWRHQRISGELFRQLANQLRGRRCQASAALTDVRLPVGDEDDDFVANVVQPDVLVVCDPSKIDERGVRGAPDFAAEILSPSSTAHDRETKVQLYARRGVREYWIIDPDANTVEIRLLGEGRQWGEARVLGPDGGVVALASVRDVQVDLAELFETA